jgi:sialic acid synthase SpsE
MADAKVTADATYTAQEMVDLIREAIAKVIKYGTSYTTDGDTITRADLPNLQKQLDYWTAAAKGKPGIATNLVRLKPPR